LKTNSSNSKKFLTNENGAGLVEVMVSFAIIAMIALVLGNVMTQSSVTSLNLRTASSRDMVLSRLQKLAINNRALTLSSNYASNTNFANCTGGASSTPNSCVHNRTPADTFVLLDSAGLPAAGTPSQPVYYDPNGSVCPAPNVACPLEAFTTFTAACPGSVSPCTYATSVTIQILVRQVSTVDIGGVDLKPRTVSAIALMPFSYGPGVTNYLAKFNNLGRLVEAGGSVEILDTSNNYFLGVGFPIALGNPSDILEVNGELRLRQPAGLPSACSPSQAGEIRYNSGYPVTEFCNGSVWMQMGPYDNSAPPPTPPPVACNMNVLITNGYIMCSGGSIPGTTSPGWTNCVRDPADILGRRYQATCNNDGSIGFIGPI
jgi:type II secretory pathway pseudopilin PulG